MNFDPAVTAWQVFTRVQASSELGDDLAAAVAAEERFSGGTGEEVSEAYHELVAIGARHPEATLFGEFLVYITWSHLMDETAPEHFKRGLALCQHLLRGDLGGDAARRTRLRSMEQSFRAGLGEKTEALMVEYDTDALKGGD